MPSQSTPSGSETSKSKCCAHSSSPHQHASPSATSGPTASQDQADDQHHCTPTKYKEPGRLCPLCLDEGYESLALLFADINQKATPPLPELVAAMSSNTNTTTNTNVPRPQANTSSRRAPDTYTHISRLASPPLWTNLGTISFSQQNYLYLRSRQCGNVTSRPQPLLQYLKYVAGAMDTQTGVRIRTLLCRDCAFEVCPDFVRRIEEGCRRAR
ncbi:hypothetical protein F5Y02DRAFT_424990 [Annulohypoxylon stygium]|nr:hypothetical protein F5Y02DRAFT_424990 [Annulohypoxylon stygium]